MKTEEKAKVVASVWGVRFYSIPCHASCFALDDLNYRMNHELHQDDLKEEDEFIIFFKIGLGTKAIVRQGIE